MVPTADFGAKTHHLTSFFFHKLHENERIWTERGAHVPSTPPGSANGNAAGGLNAVSFVMCAVVMVVTSCLLERDVMFHLVNPHIDRCMLH